MNTVVAVIIDIVRSRALADRVAAQRTLRAVFADADRVVSPVQELWPTVGDEFQTIYAQLPDALRATALVRLTLPDGIDCRFGLGIGDVTQVEPTGVGGGIQDGSAWWNAREAITTVHGRQRHGHPYARTWFVGGDQASEAVVNAYLLNRDQVLSRMKSRERRWAAGLFSGQGQAEIARTEGVSQPAVSQNLQRSGATALAYGLDLMSAATRP